MRIADACSSTGSLSLQEKGDFSRTNPEKVQPSFFQRVKRRREVPLSSSWIRYPCPAVMGFLCWSGASHKAHWTNRKRWGEQAGHTPFHICPLIPPCFYIMSLPGFIAHFWSTLQVPPLLLISFPLMEKCLSWKNAAKTERNKTEHMNYNTSFPSPNLRLSPDVPVCCRVSDFGFGVSSKGKGRA